MTGADKITGKGRGARRQAEQRGRRAETIAAAWLLLKGYRILARRFRGRGARAGEIDLIARRGGLISFVEVKARADETSGIVAVTPESQARISAAAEQYLARHPDLARCRRRFDIMIIRPGRLPRHHAAAFQPD